MALFVALDGSAYAATKIGTKQLKNKAVTTAKIKNGAVTTAKIKNGAVAPAKIKNGAVGSAKIADGAVGNAKIADGAVGSAKIGDAAITTAKLADEQVTEEKTSFDFNSGLIKLSNGEQKVIYEEGPFTLRATCEEGGGDASIANLLIKNTGSEQALIFSDYLSNYSDPIASPGDEKEAFYTVNNADPYWFGDYWNNFSATSADGKTSLFGAGNIGVKVLGVDCVYQLFLFK